MKIIKKYQHQFFGQSQGKNYRDMVAALNAMGCNTS
jgi:hypothetical protein